MYSPYRIKRSASSIGDKGKSIENKLNQLNRQVDSMNRWWSGDASQAFVDVFYDIKKDFSRLDGSIGELENGMRRLATAVDRADEERKRDAKRKRKVKPTFR